MGISVFLRRSLIRSAVLISLLFSAPGFSADLIITGVVDGPLSGGVPKAIEFYAVNDIADLSVFGAGSANNGGGTDGEEFSFPPGGIAAGEFLYLASEGTGFTSFFGFAPDFTSGAASINGDDAIELFENGLVVDVFGEINVDGSGQAWEYQDGWAYRADGTGPDGSTFFLSNWTFSGPNALDGESSNDTAVAPFPLGTYVGGAGGDSAPLVVSTSPADGEGNVAVDSSVSVNFSEPVVAAGAWFSIACSVSGDVSAVESGGPQSYVLTPDVEFVNSESCQVIILADQVTDVDADDPPDNLLADFVFDFAIEGVAMADTIIINEIMQNPARVRDSSGEWFELFNTTQSAIEINGWTVRDNDSDSFVIDAGGSLVVPAGGFAVLGNNADPNVNGGVSVDYQYVGMFLGNGSDELVLLDGSLAEVDRVEWDNGAAFPDPSGASMSLISPELDNNLGENWCTAGTPFGDGDAGTPGQNNDCGFQPVINEIDYDQPGGDSAEFIEIKNRGADAGDLSAVTLVLVNGNGGSVYGSFPLPAVDLLPGEYFVICADAATVAECDLEVLSSIQNGAPDAVALVVAGRVLDTVSYEGDTVSPYTEGSGDGLADSGASGQDFKSISRLPDGTDSNRNNLDLAATCITPGAPNTSVTEGCTANGPVLEIYQIQGDTLASPFAGQAVGTAQNVVTAVGPDGFAMQTPTARSDGDINTSDGIFVFTGSAPGVAVGDLVDVRGVVEEFFGFTEFEAGSSVAVIGSMTLPAPVTLDATVPSPDSQTPSCAIEFECYEGMLVSIADGTVTASNQRFGSDPIAEVFITAADQRTFREPGLEFPGLPGLPVWDGNPEVFELDPDKLGLSNAIIPAGSSFSAEGIIGFEFGGYELWPSELNVLPAPLPVPVRQRGPGEMTVGSLNLFRLFDDVIDGNELVLDSNVYERRLSKFSVHIREVLGAPDILSVQEVEKLGVLQDLSAVIAADDPSVQYDAYLAEGNDVGGIDVGFLIRATVTVDQVTQLAAAELLSFDGSLLHDRPPLLLKGRNTADGSDFPISVMAVHNRSLGGIEDPVDGIRVRQKRLEQAQSIARLVQDIQLADPEVNLVVIGDFNAFEFSDGYVDVVGQIKGDFDPGLSLLSGPDLVDPDLINQVEMLNPDQRYSFIFRGNAQALDHALTSSALDRLVQDIAYGRGNADAAVGLINDGTTPLRSSDHDGLVLFLIKDSDRDTIPDNLDQCGGTTIPELVPTQGLGTNRWALVDDDTVFDTKAPKGRGPERRYTLADTAGCSCEQIIEAQGLGNGHVKFGCSVGAMDNWVDQVNP